MSWRAASLRTGLDLERPYDRTTVRPDTNVLRPVVRMRTTQVPHRQASTPRPPHAMFLTRPSPSLAIFLRVTLRACGGRPGNEATHYAYRLFSLFSRHISQTQSFQQNRHIIFPALVAPNLLVSLISRLVACSARIVADKQTDKQTHRTTTVTLAAHARAEG